MKQVLPSLGPKVLYVSIDVIPSESADLLRRYADRNGFFWRFAVAGTEMDQALTNRFGSGFLTTTSVPMFVVDGHGQIHVAPFGHKSAKDLEGLVSAFESS